MTTPGRHALVVVTSTYEDAGLGALRAPLKDAAGLAEVLGDTSVGDFDVEVLSDPTVQQLRLAVEDFFADRSTKDTLLLHFSCHGVKNAAGKLFLAASDTYRTRLAATAIPAEYVSSLMLESRAQRAVLLLDCCYAGAFERGMLTRAGSEVQVQESFQDLERTGGKRGRAVFTASSALEYAFEGDQPVTDGKAGAGDGPSLFTGALVEGLRSGEADLDHDGEVGMSELADYVNERIRERTPHQTPQLWLFGTQGDLTIAHTGRRRAVATDLPAPLADAVHSDSRERKLWSVEDLGTLLCGTDVGVALAAHAALSELAADDSRRVAERAERALALAAPGVETPVVEVGAAEAAVVKVTGPPIVLATLEARTDPWLKVRYLETGIELVPEPEGPGRHEGKVELRTVTGELAITVATGTAAGPATEPGTGTAAESGKGRTAKPWAMAWPGSRAGTGNPVPKTTEETQGEAQDETHDRTHDKTHEETPDGTRRRTPAEPEPVTSGQRTSWTARKAARARAAAASPLSPWPFPLAAVAMVLALWLPFYEKIDKRGYPMWLASPADWYWPLGGVGAIMLVLAVLSLVACIAAAFLVLLGSPALRRPALVRSCIALAAVSVFAMVLVWITASVVRSDFDAGPGFTAFAVGSLLQAWGAEQLRLNLRAAGTGAKGAGPLPEARSLQPCTFAAVVMALVLPIPLGSGGPAWQLITLLEWRGGRQVASAVILVSAVASVAVAVHAWSGHAVARVPGLIWCYGALALLTLWATVFFWTVLGGQAGFGQYLLTLGCALQLWTAAALWRDRPSAAGRPSHARGPLGAH
ncbi:caspase domain-containing protein [Streptomyces sp. NBC_00158]|uniref:caspase family protein n=1 Tax=Streptomyces sp. NBC_00158 TaxID=2903627 RepID=UPI00324A1881